MIFLAVTEPLYSLWFKLCTEERQAMLQCDKTIYNLSFPPKDAAHRASIENSDHAARMHMLI